MTPEEIKEMAFLLNVCGCDFTNLVELTTGQGWQKFREQLAKSLLERGVRLPEKKDFDRGKHFEADIPDFESGGYE